MSEEWWSGACVGGADAYVVGDRGCYAVYGHFLFNFFRLDGVAEEVEWELEEGLALWFACVAVFVDEVPSG